MPDHPQRPRRSRGSATGDSPRTDARERALTLLYEAETKQIAPSEVLAALVLRADQFTERLVLGVQEHREQFDGLIAEHAKGWALDRMPLIDRAVLRIALFELSFETETPVAVIINEAVELAKRFSTDDSSRFVNGMLSTLAPKLRA